MKVDTHFLIIGLGLLGGSYAQGLTRENYAVKAIDINHDSIVYAMQQGWILPCDKESKQSLLDWADVIIFGLYPRVMIDWITQHASCFKKGTIITDVCGVKVQVVDEIQRILPEQVEFIAGHPMAGKEVSGVQYANADIFKPANYLITPTQQNTPQAIELVKKLAQTLRFRHIAILTCEQHDKMIGFLSQLTHVIAVSLMNTSDNTHLVDYTGDSFRDLTRIAKINESLWTELFLMNKENLVREITEFSDELNYFKDILMKEDTEEMKRLFRQSTQRRKCFDR